jgi:hypothetical protein
MLVFRSKISRKSGIFLQTKRKLNQKPPDRYRRKILLMKHSLLFSTASCFSAVFLFSQSAFSQTDAGSAQHVSPQIHSERHYGSYGKIDSAGNLIKSSFYHTGNSEISYDRNGRITYRDSYFSGSTYRTSFIYEDSVLVRTDHYEKRYQQEYTVSGCIHTPIPEDQKLKPRSWSICFEYEYDDRHRIVKECQTDSLRNVVQEELITYDQKGNKVRVVRNGTVYDCDYNEAGQTVCTSMLFPDSTMSVLYETYENGLNVTATLIGNGVDYGIKRTFLSYENDLCKTSETWVDGVLYEQTVYRYELDEYGNWTHMEHNDGEYVYIYDRTIRY